MNEIGAKPAVGQRWAGSSLHHMLRNPVYVGRPCFGKLECQKTWERTPSGKGIRRTTKLRPQSEWIKLSCPAIITEALFAAVQARLDANREQLHGRPSGNWPLSGIVFCGICQGTKGGPLRCRGHRIQRETKTYRYYLCASKMREDMEYCGTCFNGDVLEELAQLALRNAAEPGWLARFAREEAERIPRQAGDPAAQTQQLQADLIALDTVEEEIADLHLAGFSRELMQRRLQAVHQTREGLQKRLGATRALVGAVADPAEAERHAEKVAGRLRQDLEEALADPVRFKELCRLFLTIMLYPDRNPVIDTRVPVAFTGGSH